MTYMVSVSHFIVASLPRGERPEQLTVGFEVKQCRAVETIEASHE
jgi:hypothetical protein